MTATRLNRMVNVSGGGEGVVREFAPAKINLALHVVGRRADGYHLLDSLVAFADIGDEVTAERAESITLDLSGPMAIALEHSRNLVLEAAWALAAASGRTGLGASLRLDKHLPVASGIGGGSSDAAATLRALDRLWNLQLDPGRLAEIGSALGADVPVCVHASSARMRGVGEIVEPVRLPALKLLLVNPGIALSTAAVFSRLERSDNAGLPKIPLRAAPSGFVEYLAGCRNDLERPAVAAEPSIALVLRALSEAPGCHLARMSGSGATCFGIFLENEALEAAEARIAGDQPKWWVRRATIG